MFEFTKYNDQVKEVLERCKKIANDPTNSDCIREQCHMLAIETLRMYDRYFSAEHKETDNIKELRCVSRSFFCPTSIRIVKTESKPHSTTIISKITQILRNFG